MKVGIMSMQRVKNYGSFLQAYALKATVEQLGYEVEFVDFTVEKPIINYNGKSIKGNLKNDLRRIKDKIRKSSEKCIFFVIYGIKNQKDNYKKSENFLKTYNQKYLSILGIDENIKNIQPIVDTLIIGSDEVFNCLQGAGVGYSKELFGYNSKAKKKISYAASFGFTTYEKLQQYHIYDEIKTLLKGFSSLSARDENTESIISKMGCKSEKNLDPVFIYSFENEIVERKRERYILVYSYTSGLSIGQKLEIIKFARKHGLKTICMGGYQNFCDEYVDATPFEVLGYFKNAEYVVTSTFHGTVLSLKYNVPFVTIVKQYNMQKLTSLLERFLLTDRIVKNNKEIEIKLVKPIEYERVNDIIRKEKIRAISYLKQNI